MAPQQLMALYNNLQRAFDARPSDLKRCGTLLAQLKVFCCRARSVAGY
jgi:26S proteasome regulatory subunit N12